MYIALPKSKLNLFFMKNLLTLAMLLIAMTLTFTSCKKDDDKQNNNNNSTPTPTANKTQLLTAGPWKLTGYSYVFMGDTFNGLSELEPCELDDLLRFNTNFSGNYDGAQNECDPGFDDFDFAWSWNSNETILTWDDEPYDLIDLTSTTLKLKYVWGDGDYDLFTFTKQ
jgi:hypothetical protein